ncbi:MAG: hypothetical protein LBT68_08500 [Spirochaetales bacterium]|jgi:hypothetical protein|nr:hypothetical protein [Spirochaetales bacterium]
MNAAIAQSMKQQGIDEQLTLRILDAWNSGRRQTSGKPLTGGFPKPDGRTILDMTRLPGYSVSEKDARQRLAPLLPGIRLEDFSAPAADRAAKTGNSGEMLFFSRENLETLGTLLFPYISFGVLNGGSATSYCDTKKNEAASSPLFSLLAGPFGESAASAQGKPKGITPAYANPGGSPGYSFLELKLRCLLLQARRWRALAARYHGAYGASKTSGIHPLARKLPSHPRATQVGPIAPDR